MGGEYEKKKRREILTAGGEMTLKSWHVGRIRAHRDVKRSQNEEARGGTYPGAFGAGNGEWVERGLKRKVARIVAINAANEEYGRKQTKIEARKAIMCHPCVYDKENGEWPT